MKHSIFNHTVPRETFNAIDTLTNENRSLLDDYLNQLLWWNERTNLVSRDVSRETIADHITHSLLLHKFECFRQADIVVDAGTGGGLPGLPLSILNPNKRFLLNDIVSKKVIAVKQIVQKLNLHQANTFDGSIAELAIDQPFLLISKHAFKINTLFKLTRHLPWTEMVFYKGIYFEDELEGIDRPISISVNDLFENSGNNFYKEKALIIISR